MRYSLPPILASSRFLWFSALDIHDPLTDGLPAGQTVICFTDFFEAKFSFIKEWLQCACIHNLCYARQNPGNQRVSGKDNKGLVSDVFQRLVEAEVDGARQLLHDHINWRMIGQQGGLPEYFNKGYKPWEKEGFHHSR